MIIDRSSPIPQYFQLQTWLIEQVDQGIFKPKDKIPTESEISEITGLARATIRQAIFNLVNMGYLERKRRLGTFVLDRSAMIGKKTIIGIMIPDIRSGYSPELARGVEDEAAKNGHSIILCNTDDLYIKAAFHTNRLIENSVGGVIFIPTAATDDKNRLILEKFTHKNIPVVLADRQIPNGNFDSVCTNNFEGAYLQTQYLIKKGHQKIAIILSSLFNTERERLEGYKKALTDFNLPINSNLIYANPEPFSENLYGQVVNKILAQKKHFTAIFCGHDRIAFLFYTAARKMGLKFPDDLSIVGYDDLPFTHTHPLALTTMHQPIYEIGQHSMKLILARIQNPDREPHHVILNSYLVERYSVRSLFK